MVVGSCNSLAVILRSIYVFAEADVGAVLDASGPARVLSEITLFFGTHLPAAAFHSRRSPSVGGVVVTSTSARSARLVPELPVAASPFEQLARSALAPAIPITPRDFFQKLFPAGGRFGFRVFVHEIIPQLGYPVQH